MQSYKKFSRLIIMMSMMVMMVFAVTANAQEDGGIRPPNPAPPNWQAPSDGSVPPAAPVPPTDGQPPPPRDGFAGNRPHRPTYTASTTVVCAPETRLENETQGEVAQSYSSIRESIGSSDVLTVMPSGAVFDILDGALCSGPHYWYQVSYNGVVGWVAEGNLSEYWLEPVNLD